MKGSLKWRIGIVVIVLLASIWFLIPTFRFYSIPKEKRKEMLSSTDKDERAKINNLQSKSIHLGLDLQGGMHLVLEVDKSELTPEEAKDVRERALEIIRNRVDQFGISEPIIQPEGDERIVVQLPGVDDAERARAMVKDVAHLEEIYSILSFLSGAIWRRVA